MPEVIYEDNDILVVYKPAGIAVQTRRFGQPDMESILKNYRAGKKEPPYIGTVHRLDQPVEGVMVFGKNQKATASLSAQIKERRTGKFYYAIGRRRTEGKTPAENFPGIPVKGSRVSYLGFDVRKNLGYLSSAADRNAKKAVLDYRILGTIPERGEICFGISLHSGRHHQIRLQMAELGYPLAGDTKYGNLTEDALWQKTQKAKREEAAAGQDNPKTGEMLALSSCGLTFCHPLSGKQMRFFHLPQNPAFAGYLLKEPWE